MVNLACIIYLIMFERGERVKFLFIDAYFFPENTAFSHLENDVLNHLVESGHTVTVICPTPTRGIDETVAKEYKHRKTETLFSGGVTVKRFYAPTERGSVFFRFIRYIWCNICSLIFGMREHDVDVVFSASTPPTQGIIAALIAKKLHCKFLYSLHDLFPDSLVTSGITSEQSLLFKLGAKTASFTYKRADRIIAISQTVREHLLNNGVSAEKIDLIKNWVNVDDVKPVPRAENRLISELSLNPEDFLVVYAGNFGNSQDTDILLKAAERLADYVDIKFVVFGAGEQFTQFCDKVREKRLKNFVLSPLLPLEYVSEVYSLGDVSLVLCKKNVSLSGMPSKTWSIMACDTPVICACEAESELAGIIYEANAGVCIPSEAPNALISAVLDFRNGNVSSEYRGREYISKNLSSTYAMGKFTETVESIIKQEE